MSVTYSTPAPARSPLRIERAPRMVAALDGYPVPAHLTQRTDLNDLPVAISVFLRLNEGRVAGAP